MTLLTPGANIGLAATLLATLALNFPSIVRAQEGPSSTGADLHDGGDPLTDPQYRSSVVKDVLAPWFDFKEGVAETYGPEFGLDYQALYQRADNKLGDDEASSGQFRMFGAWTPFADEAGNSGGLTVKVENRHAYTDVAPQDLGFQAGALSIVGTSFSDSDDWLLTDASWTQRFNDGRAAVRGGLVDVTDYVDVYGLINPRTAFFNLAFLTNPTVPAPDQGIGLAGSAMLTDNFYAIGGIADANGDPSLSDDPFDSFFDTGEYFVHGEIGYTSAQERIFFDNIHLTAWHVDERDDAGVSDDWGLAGSAAWFLDNRWVPFLRAGFSQGDAPLYETTVSTGIGRLTRRRDLMAVGLNWSEPGDSALRDQWTIEAFHRFQISENLAITPDLQLIFNPALNPDDDLLTIAGIRARIQL